MSSSPRTPAPSAVPTAEEVRAAVSARDDELVDLLSRLVRVPSLRDAEGPALDVVETELRRRRAQVDRRPVLFAELAGHPAFADDGGSPDGREVLLATWPGVAPSEGRSLVVNGHLDVVPTGPRARWSDHPFSGRVEGGRVHGRGSADTKGGLVAALVAVSALQDLGVRLAGDLLLQAVTGEESGGVGTLTALRAGHVADAAVVLEPTRLQVCPVQSGCLGVRIVVHGRGSHGATAYDGVSALDVFDRVRARLRTWEVERAQALPASTTALYEGPLAVAPVSFGRVVAGEWPSSVAEQLVAEGRVGIPPGTEVVQTREELARVVALATADAPAPGEVSETEPPFETGETDVAHPFVTAARQAHRDAAGVDAEVAGVPYGSDLRLFTRYAGVPAVLYGPGDIRSAHAVDESVELAAVRTAARALASLAVRWCGIA